MGRALHAMVGGQQLDRALTPGLASTIRRMTGETSEGRFLDLGAVVRALEAELGVVGLFLPRAEEAAALEASARAFNEVPMARLRPKLAPGMASVVGLFAILAILASLVTLVTKPLYSIGAIAFGAIVGASEIAIRGLTSRDPLFDRARELLVGGSSGDRLTALAVVVLTGGRPVRHRAARPLDLPRFAGGRPGPGVSLRHRPADRAGKARADRPVDGADPVDPAAGGR